MDNIVCWLQSTLQRIYPSSPAAQTHSLQLISARNARVSFQVCARNLASSSSDLSVAVTAPAEADLQVTVRRVGYVPVAHHNTATPLDELDGVGHIPGYVPDPLFNEQTVTIGPLESQSFWISVFVPAAAQPGVHDLQVECQCDGMAVAKMIVQLDLRPISFAVVKTSRSPTGSMSTHCAIGTA